MNEQYMNQPNNGLSVAMGFMCGAVLGAGLALLLAPASGTETRRRIGDTAKRLGEDARHRVDRARETLGQLKEDAQSAIETGRETFRGARSQPGSTAYSDTSTRPA